MSPEGARRRPASPGVGGCLRTRRGAPPRIRSAFRSRSPKGWLPGRRGSSTTASGFPFGMGVGPPGLRFRPAPDAGRDHGRSRWLRPAARCDLGGDRQPRARHAQVPGHGAVRRPAVRPGRRALPSRRDDHCGPLGGRRRFAVRRGGYLYRRARALRRRRCPGRARPRTGRAGAAGARGARAVRRRGNGRRPRAGRLRSRRMYAPCEGACRRWR